jgi:hypothetical protein
MPNRRVQGHDPLRFSARVGTLLQGFTRASKPWAMVVLLLKAGSLPLAEGLVVAQIEPQKGKHTCVGATSKRLQVHRTGASSVAVGFW